MHNGSNVHATRLRRLSTDLTLKFIFADADEG